jgi:hypothetical protein
MPTYNPKELGEPEVIREINPTVLCAFLQPFEGYLRSRGLEVKVPSRIDNATAIECGLLRGGDVDAHGR